MNERITITVVFDNEPYGAEFEAGWGFSAFVEGAEKRILFDTGADGSKLLGNMSRLRIGPGSIDSVVLSHIHADHTGGLEGFLETRADIEVYVPSSFPDEIKNKIRKYGARLIEVGRRLQICEGIYSTGQTGRRIKEQGLVVQTEKGVVLIVGCAHPGVVKMAEAAKQVAGGQILLLIGGFHLEWSVGFRIKWIISELKRLGVRYATAAHCTGRKARGLFERAFGDNYISAGAGKVIKVFELE